MGPHQLVEAGGEEMAFDQAEERGLTEAEETEAGQAEESGPTEAEGTAAGL